MNDTPYAEIAPPRETMDEEALRKRLVSRIAIAGVVIVALLGGLALIDTLYVAPATPVPKTQTPQAIEVTDAPGAAIAISAAAKPESPQPEAVPTIKRQAEPEETASPSLPLPKETRPAIAGNATSKTEAAVATHSMVSRPLTRDKGLQAEHGFVLQMGVFRDVSNAQELLAKIQKAGVPAQIEARVQVGPFKTRQEADEARAKLTAAGFDAGLLMATHR